MSDKNGKIEGKFNIIDLLIIVVILVVIGFVVYRFFIRNNMDISNDEPVIIEYTCDETGDYTAERLKLGATVLEGDTNNVLGTVVDIKIGEAVFYTVNDKNETVLMSRPDRKSVVITIEGTGTLDENGLLIERFRYGIGYSMVVFVNECKLWGKISAIDPA